VDSIHSQHERSSRCSELLRNFDFQELFRKFSFPELLRKFGFQKLFSKFTSPEMLRKFSFPAGLKSLARRNKENLNIITVKKDN
jgi:hypothetical protein